MSDMQLKDQGGIERGLLSCGTCLPAWRTLASDQSEILASEEGGAKRPRTPIRATSPRSELAYDDDMPLLARSGSNPPVKFGVIDREHRRRRVVGVSIAFLKNSLGSH